MSDRMKQIIREIRRLAIEAYGLSVEREEKPYLEAIWQTADLALFQDQQKNAHHD